MKGSPPAPLLTPVHVAAAVGAPSIPVRVSRGGVGPVREGQSPLEGGKYEVSAINTSTPRRPEHQQG